MSARTFAYGLVLLVAATSGCKKPNPNRCEVDGDCANGQTCDKGTNYCMNKADGGPGATAGSGGAGGAAGAKGTGGTPFSCADTLCPDNTPICNMAARSCEKCADSSACQKLDSTRPLCVPGDAGSTAGMCVSCLANSDCMTAQAPICNPSTGTCEGCDAAGATACATRDTTNPVCVTTATATLLKGMCVGCLMDTQCTTPQTPICSLDTGTCEGCDVASATACATKNSTNPVCAKAATGGLAKGTCVGCLMNSDCSNPKMPICKSNSCAGCSADSDCSGVGSGICIADGHCATVAETIYVKNDTSVCNDSPMVSANAGTSTQPFCTMQPIPVYLSPARDLIIVSGLVSGATWSYNDNVTGGQLSIVGQLGAQIASSAVPGFSLQGGNVYIRGVNFSPSGSIGIKSTGGTITLYGVTVDGCMGGGIFLSGTTFDIENTTVTDNGPGPQGTSGGMNISTAGAGSKLNLVTIENNNQIGITCDAAIAATGVYVMSNTGGNIAMNCKFSSCPTLVTGCGAP